MKVGNKVYFILPYEGRIRQGRILDITKTMCKISYYNKEKKTCILVVEHVDTQKEKLESLIKSAIRTDINQEVDRKIKVYENNK